MNRCSELWCSIKMYTNPGRSAAPTENRRSTSLFRNSSVTKLRGTSFRVSSSKASRISAGKNARR